MKLFELQDRPEQEKNFPRDIMPQIRKGNLQDSPFTFEKGNISVDISLPSIMHLLYFFENET